MTGDYILSIASIMISRLRNDDVTLVLSQVSDFEQFFPASSSSRFDILFPVPSPVCETAVNNDTATRRRKRFTHNSC